MVIAEADRRFAPRVGRAKRSPAEVEPASTASVRSACVERAWLKAAQGDAQAQVFEPAAGVGRRSTGG